MLLTTMALLAQVNVISKKMFDERWNVVSLPGRLHQADFTISHADVTRNSGSLLSTRISRGATTHPPSSWLDYPSNSGQFRPHRGLDLHL